MTLDLVQISTQIGEMTRQLRESRQPRNSQMDRARRWFAQVAPDWERLGDQVRRSSASAAVPLEPLDAFHPLPPVPSCYEVMATDGSSIEPDRHGPAMCAVINVGRVRIRYGDTPAASLDCQPVLLCGPDTLYVTQGGRKMLLGERLLDVKRSVAEMRALSDLASAEGSGAPPRVALADGLLTVWRQDWAGADFSDLTAEFASALDRIADYGLPVAAYVRQPHSHWVADLLRFSSECRRGPDLCKAQCAGDSCALEGILDDQAAGRICPVVSILKRIEDFFSVAQP